MPYRPHISSPPWQSRQHGPLPPPPVKRAGVQYRDRCLSCPDGSHSPPGSGSPANCTCNAGYTPGGGGGPACVACGAGKYKAGAGAGKCSACPEGKVSRAEAATDPSVCRCGSVCAAAWPSSLSVWLHGARGEGCESALRPGGRRRL
jgi:hypothetical protein